MGVDLTLVIDKYRMDPILAYDRLSLDEDTGLHVIIESLHAKKLKQSVSWYGYEGIERTREDYLGCPLTYILVEDFKKVNWEKVELSPWNRAILTMVSMLPANTKIILYWH